MKTPLISAMLLSIASADEAATTAWNALIDSRKATPVPTDCEDASTATARAAKARADGEK